MSSVQRQTAKCTSLWIHCNKCFESYINKQKTIYILSCYDVVCEKCLTFVSKNEIKCSICKNNVRGYPIGNNLPANLKDLFHPRPWSLSFNKVCSVMKFQTKQRDKFILGCRKLKEFTKSLEKERAKLKEECKEIFLLQKKQKNEKSKLTKCLEKLKEAKLSRKFDHQRSEKKHQNEFDMFEIQRQYKRNNRDREIPSTCQVFSKQDDSFDFPLDNTLSKSFYL